MIRSIDIKQIPHDLISDEEEDIPEDSFTTNELLESNEHVNPFSYDNF